MSEHAKIAFETPLYLPEQIYSEVVPNNMQTLFHQRDITPDIGQLQVQAAAAVHPAIAADHAVFHDLYISSDIELHNPLANPTTILNRTQRYLQNELALLEQPHLVIPREPGLLTLQTNPDARLVNTGHIMALNAGMNWVVNSVCTINANRRESDDDIPNIRSMLDDHIVMMRSLANVLALSGRGAEMERTVYSFDSLLELEETEDAETGSLVAAEAEPVDVAGHFEKFVGIDHVVEQLTEVVHLADMPEERREQYDIELNQAVLLYGPSGLAKTALMQSLGEALGADIDFVDFSDISDKYVGEWASNIDRRFNAAYESAYRTLIVFDEFDGLINSGNPGSTGNITAVLKRQLEKIKDYPHVFVAAATNNIDAIDSVILADKRFPTKIAVHPPNETGRAAIFNHFVVGPRLKNASDNDMFKIFEEIAHQEYDFTALAKITEGMSGGDIREIVKSAQRKKILATPHDQEPAPLTQDELLIAVDKARKSRPQDV